MTRGSHLCSESTNLVKVNPHKHFWRLSRRASGSSESGPCALRQMRAFPRFYTHSIGSSISKTTTWGQPELPPRNATFILPGVLTTKKGKQDPALGITVVLETACKCGTTSLLNVKKKGPLASMECLDYGMLFK